MSKGSIFSWNKAPQSLYSLWYSALKMQTKARQGKANQSHPRHGSPGAREFPSSPRTHLSVIFFAVWRKRA